MVWSFLMETRWQAGDYHGVGNQVYDCPMEPKNGMK